MHSFGENKDRTSEFMKLLVSHQAKVFVYILSLVPRKNDAEDVLQETLTEMWNKFDHYTPDTNFGAWAITIAKYKVYNYRKKHWNTTVIFDDSLAAMIDKKIDQRLGGYSEYFAALKICTEKLPDKDADILKMRYEENLTCKSIGSALNISHQAVSKIMARILALLLKCIRTNLGNQGLYYE